jgi:hypothetical protein
MVGYTRLHTAKTTVWSTDDDEEYDDDNNNNNNNKLNIITHKTH